MDERKPLSPEEREAAFAALRGQDLAGIPAAAKKLSDDPTTTARLLELLDGETRPEARQGILYALSWHADLGTWGLMIRIFADPRETPAVRGQAAEGLSYMFYKLQAGCPEFEAGVVALLDGLKDGSPEVRYCAVHALGATRQRRFIPVLEKMLEDKTPVPGWMGTVADEAARAIETLTWPGR